ncbi:MAG: glycosyltransferase family 39 protein [Fibromonadaceae bacterium]|jgi:hypothetical protein|nr:glycosyltransferase family 39 protein [Fibromonadaceae bacterium]
MKIIKKILYEPLLYLLLLLIAAYLAIMISSHIEILDAKITRNGITESIILPYATDMARDEVFFVSFNLSVKSNKSVKLNIIPDDCLQELLINGEKFPLDKIKGLCDYTRGAYFDFSKYVQEGLNHFEFRIINTDGSGGMRVEMPYNGLKQFSFLHYIFVLLFLFSTVLILRKFKFKLIAILIILLGITIRLIVYTYMSPLSSPYDVREHLEYIQIVAEENRLPSRQECWECHQPPLYYIAFAGIKNVTDRYDPTLTNRILQQGHLLLSFASIVFGVAFLINLFGNNRGAYLAALIAVFWTGFVVAAPRINNDTLFYFGTLFCMLFAQRYWHWHKSSDILLASIGASIALAAKSTGFVILGIWVIIYILAAIRSLKLGSLRVLFASVFIVAFFTGFSNYRTVIDVFQGNKTGLIKPVFGLNEAMKIENSLGSFVYFDLQDYLLLPYTSAWNDEGGRQYFWNYVIKSSLYLYKEIKLYDSPIGSFFATMLCIFTLFIFILALWGIIHLKIRDIPAMLFTVFLFVALVYHRIIHPYACNMEFRYIFPVLFPLSYFSVRGVQILQDSRLRKFGIIILSSFTILSFLFIVGQAL